MADFLVESDRLQCGEDRIGHDERQCCRFPHDGDAGATGGRRRTESAGTARRRSSTPATGADKTIKIGPNRFAASRQACIEKRATNVAVKSQFA